MSYRGARESGAVPPRSGKAPMGWSAAETSKRFEDEDMPHSSWEPAARSKRDEAVADHAAGGGGGGAKLPFMIEHLYLQPVKVGTMFSRSRLSPPNQDAPSWALK
mmetsp:Transcript_54514/g.122648  ORF Transcript_54514/g.122648 Transcript_54514/m.122648 type:complete len:105 (+) Transcript_54514:89-403(+)